MQPKTAMEFLKKGLVLLEQRGKEYTTTEEEAERSFASVAACFKAKTGIGLTPAHVCLLLQDLKDIRQFSQDRLHRDSIEDCVNYAALKAEELVKQYAGCVSAEEKVQVSPTSQESIIKWQSVQCKHAPAQKMVLLAVENAHRNPIEYGFHDHTTGKYMMHASGWIPLELGYGTVTHWAMLPAPPELDKYCFNREETVSGSERKHTLMRMIYSFLEQQVLKRK